MKFLALLPLAASVLPSVFGHGFVSEVTVQDENGSKTFKGPSPGSNVGNFAIRLIKNTEPNHIDDGDNLACGKGAATRGAKQMAKAAPGAKITFKWDAGDGTPWPHDTGPLITYFAKCDGDCSTFDASKGKWFKADQVGKTKVPSNSWIQGTEVHKGKDYSFTLADNFPAGDYLMRHEIIALHLADQPKGAEFYPSCTQITITGDNTGTPDNTVSFPGGYDAEDPGIHINIWDKLGAYPFPGPEIVSFSGKAATNTGNSNASSGNSTSSASSSSTTGTSVSNSSSDDSNDDDNSSSSDDGYSYSSNDANDDSGSNESSSEEEDDAEGCTTTDEGTDDEEASTTEDSGEECATAQDNAPATTTSDDEDDSAVKTVTVTVTVTASPTPKVRAREFSSAPRRSRMHFPRRHQ